MNPSLRYSPCIRFVIPCLSFLQKLLFQLLFSAFLAEAIFSCLSLRVLLSSFGLIVRSCCHHSSCFQQPQIIIAFFVPPSSFSVSMVVRLRPWETSDITEMKMPLISQPPTSSQMEARRASKLYGSVSTVWLWWTKASTLASRVAIDDASERDQRTKRLVRWQWKTNQKRQKEHHLPHVTHLVGLLLARDHAGVMWEAWGGLWLCGGCHRWEDWWPSSRSWCFAFFYWEPAKNRLDGSCSSSVTFRSPAALKPSFR